MKLSILLLSLLFSFQTFGQDQCRRLELRLQQIQDRLDECRYGGGSSGYTCQIRINSQTWEASDSSLSNAQDIAVQMCDMSSWSSSTCRNHMNCDSADIPSSLGYKCTTRINSQEWVSKNPYLDSAIEDVVKMCDLSSWSDSTCRNHTKCEQIEAGFHNATYECVVSINGRSWTGRSRDLDSAIEDGIELCDSSSSWSRSTCRNHMKCSQE